MSKSSIEWTESTRSKKMFKSACQFHRNRYFLIRNPSKNIFIFLRRIARRASRNNIFNFGTTAFGNWDDMVKCCSRRIAVSAVSFKLCHNSNLNFRFDWFALAFAAVSVLSSLKSVFLVCEISNSCFLSLMKFAKSIFRYELNLKPLLTFTTPTQSPLPHQSPFTNSNIVCFGFITTIMAFTFQSIKTRAVFRERLYRFPLLANCAFFQTCLNPFQILGNRNSRFFCSTFNCTIFSLSHITIILVNSILAQEVGNGV